MIQMKFLESLLLRSLKRLQKKESLSLNVKSITSSSNTKPCLATEVIFSNFILFLPIPMRLLIYNNGDKGDINLSPAEWHPATMMILQRRLR